MIPLKRSFQTMPKTVGVHKLFMNVRRQTPAEEEEFVSMTFYLPVFREVFYNLWTDYLRTSCL